MTTFVRLLADKDKEGSLLASCTAIRSGRVDPKVYCVAPEAFRAVPGSPFAYWVSDGIRSTFSKFPLFDNNNDRTARQGLATSDDFRFLRLWWEAQVNEWVPFAKGGALSRYYADISLSIKWAASGAELKATVIQRYGSVSKRIYNESFYFRQGMTWPLRASCFSPQAMPSGCVFSVRGYSAFVKTGEELETISIFNSSAFDYLFKVALGRFGYPEFIVGILQKMPWPHRQAETSSALTTLAGRAWSLKRTHDTVEETSHAFILPPALIQRLYVFDTSAIKAELECIQTEIDTIAFDLFGFSDTDRSAAAYNADKEEIVEVLDTNDSDDCASPIDLTAGLLSWAVGVAFGRFDWRLATREREAPPEPKPFDALPAKSPGMLTESNAPFHAHAGILVDDKGHEHDLARLVEEVLVCVGCAVPDDIRHWIRRDFFPLHLKRYSKNSRKAPVYWPLSTPSGRYTLWIYYPDLTDQTLFSAANDFIEPKLEQHVEPELRALRAKTDRSRQEDKELEELQDLAEELCVLRSDLLTLAPSYRPNQDDGVQMTAAPLWPLFRHKPWQTVLKDTWVNLAKGDYDWAHLAMSYWPERVREKCRSDKSLAIAHGLEHLYEPPPEKEGAAGGKGRKRKGAAS